MKAESTRIFLRVLCSTYDRVISLRKGYWLVLTKANSDHKKYWGIYSRKDKGVMCWGDQYERLSSDLICFSLIRSGTLGEEHLLFSLSKGKIVVEDYSHSRPELVETNGVRAYFCKKGEWRGGVGLFSVTREEFIIPPEYDKLVCLGSGQYYGIKEDRRVGKSFYFLISINKNEEIETRETEKIV